MAKRLIIVLSLTAVLAGAALASCGGGGKPIVIGFAASLSGKDYALGVEGRKAAELFVKEANAAGGVAGRPLELLVKDLKSDDANAPPVTSELARSGACLAVGYYTSGAALAALGAEGTLPLISPAATSAALGGRRDAFFRTIMSSERDSTILAAHMKSRLFKRVLLIATASNAPYVDTYALPLAASIELVSELRYASPGEIDYAALPRDPAGGAGWDAVLIVASPLDTGSIAQELAIRGLARPLYVSGWAGNDELVQHGGRAVEGAIFVHQTDPSAPGAAGMAERYRAAFKAAPGYSAIQTWDAMLLAREALERASGDPAKVLEALRGIRSFRGIADEIALDGYGDARRVLYLKTVEGGEIRVLGKAE